jgi:hypothetical protein
MLTIRASKCNTLIQKPSSALFPWFHKFERLDSFGRNLSDCKRQASQKPTFTVLIRSADDCPIATTQDLALPGAAKPELPIP